MTILLTHDWMKIDIDDKNRFEKVMLLYNIGMIGSDWIRYHLGEIISKESMIEIRLHSVYSQDYQYFEFKFIPKMYKGFEISDNSENYILKVNFKDKTCHEYTDYEIEEPITLGSSLTINNLNSNTILVGNPINTYTYSIPVLQTGQRITITDTYTNSSQNYVITGQTGFTANIGQATVSQYSAQDSLGNQVTITI